MKMSFDTPAQAPHGVVAALAQLETVAGLLLLADPSRWDSVARPQAQDLGALILASTRQLRDELGEVVTLPGG